MSDGYIDNIELAHVYYRHVDSVYRLCFSFMKNAPEAEDMVQETFLRLISSGKVFENERHEKAWLIITASNLCKDQLKKWWRKLENLEEVDAAAPENEIRDEVLHAVMKLPREYKDVVYLYYYEGYSTCEIASFSNCAEATVRSRLSRARKKLEWILRGA